MRLHGQEGRSSRMCKPTAIGNGQRNRGKNRKGYITRTLNRQDRCSFLVAVTEQGTLLAGRFIHNLEDVAQGMLAALTPTERLVLVELFAKIRANWSNAADQQTRPATSP